MIIAIGTDVVEIERIEALMERRGQAFESRVFTAEESQYCWSRPRAAESFAARFAAKEAVMKCLGTGWSGGVRFVDIAVRRSDNGAVGVQLHGAAAARAADLGIGTILLSISHSGTVAVAQAVATAAPGP